MIRTTTWLYAALRTANTIALKNNNNNNNDEIMYKQQKQWTLSLKHFWLHLSKKKNALYIVSNKGLNPPSLLTAAKNTFPLWLAIKRNCFSVGGHMEYIAAHSLLRSFTQLASVKLPSRKFLAGVVAYSPDPLRYRYFLAPSFRYTAPLTNLYDWRETFCQIHCHSSSCGQHFPCPWSHISGYAITVSR